MWPAISIALAVVCVLMVNAGSIWAVVPMAGSIIIAVAVTRND